MLSYTIKYLSLYNKYCKFSKEKCKKNFSLDLQKNERYESTIDLSNPKIIRDIIIKQKKKEEVNNSLDLIEEKESVNIINDNNNSHNTKNYLSKNKNKKSIADDEDDILETKRNKIKRKGKKHEDEYYEDDIDINENLNNSEKISYTNLEWSTMRPKVGINLTVNRKTGHTNKKKNLGTKNLNPVTQNNNSLENKLNVPVTSINMPTTLSIADFSDLTKIPEHEIIKFLFIKGIKATVNQIIDIETSKLIANNFEVEINIHDTNPNKNKKTENSSAGDIIYKDDKDVKGLELRAPVVAILGHVDHGKTTLLDKIRQTNVVNQEAGGITQRLAAYEVFTKIEGGEHKIVFLDTPGHKAFSAMRSRGASLTDISVLIVAADDGIQPQTVEALEQIQNTSSTLIVAINKIDKPTANAQKIVNELTKYNVLSEGLGGNTKFIEISAIEGINIDILLKSIIEISNSKRLYANPQLKAEGVIIESHLDKSKGPITNILIQNGTLNIGDICLCSTTYGRVKAIVSNRQENIKNAGPSSVVEILGLPEIANVGDKFQTVSKEKEAKLILSDLKYSVNLDDLSGSRISIKSTNQEQTSKKVLSLIIKADAQGSLEAILDSLKQIPQSKIQIGLINASLGDIKETDIEMANTTNSFIIGFNTKIHNSAKSLLSKHKVGIQYFQVIYDLLEFVENNMRDMMEPEFLREEIGEAIVKNIFTISKGVVAGCFINKGKLIRGCNLEVIRNNSNVFEGTLDSLKQIKDDIYEIEEGKECGLVVNNYQEWNKNDLIKAYILTAKSPEL